MAGIDGSSSSRADPGAQRIAGAGAPCVDDPAESGQDQAVLRGVAAALERGAEHVLPCPGDCPALDPREVGALLGGSRTAARRDRPRPSRHRDERAAAVAAGGARAAFGPGCFARHAGLAAEADADRVAQLQSLALDVDTPEDLAALRAALRRVPDAAPRTRALLEHLAARSAVA